VELVAGQARVRITSVRDGVVRVRVAPDGTFPSDISWAVIESPQPSPVQVQDSTDAIRLKAGRVIVRVQKAPLLITFLDTTGNVLLADEPTLPMAWDGRRTRMWKHMPDDEVYVGLGDKPGPMDRRNRAFTLWNTDAFAWQESTDPLYKAIPFFIGLRKGLSYGLFFDNSYRTSFDFGLASSEALAIGAEGGDLNYYFLAGPEPKRIVGAFTALVGRSPLPPYWSLGYQQCRYSYYPEARVREIASTFRAKKIPADVIYLDIDYQDGYRPFTVNRKYFPHFEQLIKDLRTEGFRTITITDLHIAQYPDKGYAPYDSGVKHDVFVKNPDGSVFVGEVWPGPSVFPDFTLTRAREWWGGLYKDFVGMGVAGFWNDMNEPSVFNRADHTMPLDVVHRLDDGSTLDHRAIHNVFGMENARATYDGLRKLQPNERPFVLTRAAYAGAQRYAATWTGDNSSTWNHLALSVPQLLSLGVSGLPLVGDDIGGFVGSPPPDLLTRWFEVGALNPIYRDHTMKGSANQEPWVHGAQHEAIRRRYIELRYRLLPYIYTGIEETARTGLPLMRPLFLEYPDVAQLYHDDHEYLFGPDLLVSPVLTETVDPHTVSLPPGEWYDYWTSGKRKGGQSLVLHPALGEMPLYVRAGAILPEQHVIQSTDETPKGPLALRVYPGDACHGTLYLDDGHTFAYQRGEFLRVNYSCQVTPGAVTVTSTVERGGFRAWWSKVAVSVFGTASLPKEVRVGGNVVHDWRYDPQSHALTVTVPESPTGWTVRASF
jgi:alpha-glucosidase